MIITQISMALKTIVLCYAIHGIKFCYVKMNFSDIEASTSLLPLLYVM